MKLSFINKAGKTAFLIYPLFEKKPVADAALRNTIKKLGRTKEFEAKEGQMFLLFEGSKKLPARTLLLGLGKAEKLNVANVMAAFGAAVKKAAASNAQKVAVMFPPNAAEELFCFASAIAESIVLSNYHPLANFKTGKALKRIKNQQIKELEIIGLYSDKKAQEEFKKGLETAAVANEARDWINLPPNYANAEFFDAKAKEISKLSGAKLTILRNSELKKLCMGALLAVNRGAPDEARLLILDYLPKNADKKSAPIVFVGKGIIFDSGGYNLKPTNHIEDMHMDKSGAAAVLGLIKLLPKLNIRHRVIGIAPMTENLIGKHALKPSEIIKTHSGKTVEITNTDAEGRLVLADAVSYAIAQFKPKYLIDIATLTGSCAVALGNRYAGIFSNNKDLASRLRKAGKEKDELLWPLPIHKDYAEKMKGQYADLRNAESKGDHCAGASKGAAFIRAFVKKTKWAHLDIAGPAFSTDHKKYESKGATAFGLRLFAGFLEKME